MCAILSIGDVFAPLGETRKMSRVDRKAERPPMPRRIASDVTLQRDVPVLMSDGVQLVANVFRSFEPSRSPVLMSVTPYGKDTLPDRRGLAPIPPGRPRFRAPRASPCR